MDSLAALGTCVQRWGWQGVAAQAGRIWWALRDELVEPLEPSSAEGGSNSAVAAAVCLQRCLAAEVEPKLELDKTPAARPVQSLLDKVRAAVQTLFVCIAAFCVWAYMPCKEVTLVILLKQDDVHLGGLFAFECCMQVMEDDHVADLGQWILESSSAGQSNTALKQFATANTIFPAVSHLLVCIDQNITSSCRLPQ